jgi:hypothetical protein
MHPKVPYAQYSILFLLDFPLEHIGDTHEMVICVSVNESTVLDRPFTTRCDRLLFKKAFDYGKLPGKTADQIAELILAGMVHFLMETPNPRNVPGMYDLREEDPLKPIESPWETQHRLLYRKLFEACIQGWKF